MQYRYRNLVSETTSCNVPLLESKMPANAQSVLGQNRTSGRVGILWN